MRRSLTKRERVTDRRSVRNLFRARSTPSRGGLRVFYAARDAGCSRVVVCPARGFANAPARNRQRRLVREAYRQLKHRVVPSYDLLLQIRPRRRELGVRAAGTILATLLDEAGLLLHATRPGACECAGVSR